MQAAFDELWCLGDVVGYGPRPNECAAILRERATVCLAGNHDLVVLGKIPMAAFADDAGDRRPLDAASSRRRRAHVPGDARAAGDATGRGALPRQPSRPRLGLRALRGRGALHVRGDLGAARPRRAQPRRARAVERRARPARRQGGRRHAARAERAAPPAQSRLGRPAARRRPARRVARD